MIDSPRRTIIQIRDLAFHYPGEKPLFSALAADIGVGVTFIEGDMGSGKTTLLKLLAGELRGCGRVVLEGRAVGADPVADSRDIAWFDVHDSAFDALIAADVLADRGAVHGGADEAAFAHHVAGFGLTPHGAKPMFMLSTGSRRKVGLAVALSLGARSTLLDEPCAGLDAVSLGYLGRALADVARDDRRAIVLAGAYGLDDIPGAAVLRLGGAR